MYTRLNMPDAETRLMLEAPSPEEAVDRLSGLFRPPYWPLRLTDYPGRLLISPLSRRFHVGAVEVECARGNHPDGSTVFRLSCGGKRLVYATDYEPEDISFPELIRFCEGADLVLYDAQYTEEEYGSRKGFGHSTAMKGLELLVRSGAKKLLLIHHNPSAADKELLYRERVLFHPKIRYAREGEVYEL
jgi:ribonuclease BN (tRNA processing enzyme)